MNGEGVVFFPRKGLPLHPYRGVAHGCGFVVWVKLILQCINIAHTENQAEGTEGK